jgi:hypothetical protein
MMTLLPDFILYFYAVSFTVMQKKEKQQNLKFPFQLTFVETVYDAFLLFSLHPEIYY